MESRSYSFPEFESRSYHSPPETSPCLLDSLWSVETIAQRQYRHHAHADVWALTLALAVPRRKFRHLDLALHIPRWARIERRFVGMVVERAA